MDRLYEELSWKPLYYRRWQRLLTYFYNLVNSHTPQYLVQYIPEQRYNPYKLTEIIRPEKRSIFKVSYLNGRKRLTCLHFKFSDLRENKFTHNFYVTPKCRCSEDTETT